MKVIGMTFRGGWFDGHLNYPQICHYGLDKRHLLLLTTDDDHYMVYSSIFKRSEFFGFICSLGIIVKPYVEGGPYPEIPPPYPSAVELREIFLRGHSIVTHGYDHNLETWEKNAETTEDGRKAIASQLEKAREGIYKCITGQPVISVWFPWSMDHMTRKHGEIAREVGYIYCAQRQPYGEFHHKELNVPTMPVEVFQNTRDTWDIPDQVAKDLELGGSYTHLWGHGYIEGENIEVQLQCMYNSRSTLGAIWSTSVERSVRYAVERNCALIDDWHVEGGVWTYKLRMDLPPGFNSELYGKQIYNMPLTIKHPYVPLGEAHYAYEEKDGNLVRLKSWTKNNNLYYEVVPRNQTISVSAKPLHDPSTPDVRLSVDELEVYDPSDGKPVRGGLAYQIIVEGRDPLAQIVSWKLTIRDKSGKYYVDDFGREIRNQHLSINDWLDDRRGMIIYPSEQGHGRQDSFLIECEVTNADEMEASAIREL